MNQIRPWTWTLTSKWQIFWHVFVSGPKLFWFDIGLPYLTHGCIRRSWSQFDVDLWLQGQIYRLLSCLNVRPVTSVSFDIGIPNFVHWSIIIRGCVKYIHDPHTTSNFDLQVKELEPRNIKMYPYFFSNIKPWNTLYCSTQYLA